ncbi:hypothetical protein FGG08_000925 [Glutinoglossum americanum]|uniref:Uncharacterized protein n=1 Tax=Glutinoglossum americanum TaxID=1670608 RepID=A0A9P8I7Z9_9PEZI|nr:hypothetical protein FGG08_000925 [Glutinoglossum americanum]
MATAETVELGPPHEPKEASIEAFKYLSLDIKKVLVHLRHTHNKHESKYFAAVSSLSDRDLVAFDESDLVLVRAGMSSYGLHLFGKLRLPKSDGGYIHVRMFVGGESENKVVKLHSIYNEEKELPDGSKTFRAILSKDDPLEWFDT